MLRRCLHTSACQVAGSLVALAMSVAALATPGHAQDQCPLGQFLATYYDNTNNANKRVFTACEPTIAHDWGTGRAKKGKTEAGKTDSSDSLAVGPDNFRVTWTGRFHFQDGLYTFIATADDGIKVKVDGEMLVDEWRIQRATDFRAQKRMSAGIHTLDVEYFEAAAAAVAKLRWERTGS